MSKVLVTESYLDDIADAIRGKNGTENTYKPPQMAAAITELPDPSVLDDKTITANGTYDPSDDDLDGYSEVTVNVPNSYAAGDEGKVVSNGALVVQTARSSDITVNGTYDTTLNDEVTVNVSGGGGGVEFLARSEWNALSTAQKQAKGLVVIQDNLTGFERGVFVNGADYIAANIMQSGSGTDSATFTVNASGTYQLLVLALNSEASTYSLDISVTKNGTSVSGDTLGTNSYQVSGSNRRNYRLNVYDLSCSANDEISINVSNRNNYSRLIYALCDTNIAELKQAVTNADGLASGSYSSEAVVLYGTINGSSVGATQTVNMELANANMIVTTEHPGTSYKSAYIFWLQ